MAQSKVGNIMLTNWRIAFAHGLWQPSQVNGQGKPAFSAAFLAPPNHPDMAMLQQVLVAVARDKWGPQGDQVLQSLIAGGRICLRNGDSKPEVEGFPGHYFISARSPTKPLIIDQNRNVLEATSGKPYSGCYVNVRLNIWGMQNQHGRRINAQLAGVQFAKDGDPFSAGGAADAGEFGEIEQAAQAGNEFGDLFGTGSPAPQTPDQLIPQQQAMPQHVGGALPAAQPQPGQLGGQAYNQQGVQMPQPGQPAPWLSQ